MRFQLPAMAAAIAVTAALFSTPAANAESDRAAAPAPDPARLAETLQQRLGHSRTAGSYLDAATGALTVTVRDAAAARLVRDAGAVPRTVARSGADLARAESALPHVTGTAWAVDPAANQVVVSIDESVTGARLARVRAAAARLGDAVRTERIAGTLSTTISGGDAIYTGGSRCSLAFNVRDSSGADYFVTAGHCTNVGRLWHDGSGQTLGTTSGTVFPGSDYGVVRYTSDVDRPGNVNLYNGSYQDITRADDPIIGQRVWHSGSTSELSSGTVIELNVTVNYPSGIVVRGLIRTDICTEPGDSGGALFAGNTALGITSAGNYNCRDGNGTGYFQPVVPALDHYGLSVY